MGYVRSTLRLVWPDDSEFSGLAVNMRRLSIKKLLEVQSLQDLRASNDMAESMAAMSSILDTVAGALIGWNLEDEVEQADGSTLNVPVPATREALDDQDVSLVLDLVSNWIAVASSVPLGSRTNSSDTQPASHPEEPPVEEWASLALPSQEPLSGPDSS
jgi:hypothetical protein